MLVFTSCEDLCWLQVELLTWRLAGVAQPPPAESKRPAGMTRAVSVRNSVQQQVLGAAVERWVRRPLC